MTKLLLDTNVVIGIIEEVLAARLQHALADPEHQLYASVASLWEMAIKVRLGKLALKTPLDRLSASIGEAQMTLVAIEAPHALALVEPAPATRDPFDRLLLAQCQVEGMQLVTLDRALSAHRLAWRSS